MDGLGIQSRWEARFSAPGPETHPASYTMRTESLPCSKAAGAGVDHPPPIYLRGWRKSRATHLLTLWAFVACYRENLYLYLLHYHTGWRIFLFGRGTCPTILERERQFSPIGCRRRLLPTFYVPSTQAKSSFTQWQSKRKVSHPLTVLQALLTVKQSF